VRAHHGGSSQDIFRLISKTEHSIKAESGLKPISSARAKGPHARGDVASGNPFLAPKSSFNSVKLEVASAILQPQSPIEQCFFSTAITERLGHITEAFGASVDTVASAASPSSIRNLDMLFEESMWEGATTQVALRRAHLEQDNCFISSMLVQSDSNVTDAEMALRAMKVEQEGAVFIDLDLGKENN
jgi:hypothetical protein